MCLGDWAIHGRNTGGYYKCNLYQPKEEEEDDVESLKRLEFYMDRFMEHKNSLDHAKEEVHLLRNELNPQLTSNHKLCRLNSEVYPNCLDFYLEALEFSAKCRSFIVYTYPISFKIYNEQTSALFAEN